MKALYLIIIAAVIVAISVAYGVSYQNESKTTGIECKDLQNQSVGDNVSDTRQEIEKIVLSNSTIRNIINNNYCEFMADSTLYTQDGTYRTINVNLNNTHELSIMVSLKDNTVVSYDLGTLTRS